MYVNKYGSELPLSEAARSPRGGAGGVGGAAAGGQNVFRGTDTQPTRSPSRAHPRTSSSINLPSVNNNKGFSNYIELFISTSKARKST